MSLKSWKDGHHNCLQSAKNISPIGLIDFTLTCDFCHKFGCEIWKSRPSIPTNAFRISLMEGFSILK
jgi:hypothetical protein